VKSDLAMRENIVSFRLKAYECALISTVIIN